MPLDPKSFRQQLACTLTAPASQILPTLDEIAVIDQQAEKDQSRFTKILIGCAIAAFLSIFLAAVAPILGVPFLIGFGAAAIYAGVMVNRHGQLNLQNYRYQLAQRVLVLLQQDMALEAPVDLNLILSRPNDKKKCVGQIPHPRRSGWKIDLFRDPWLNLQGTLLDQSHFVLTSTELYQTQSGWTRSRSGKSKYKTKSKSKGLEVELHLQVTSEDYKALKLLKQDALGAIQLPPEVQLKTLKVTSQEIHLKAKTPAWVANHQTEALYQTIAMMFLSSYQILNLAKTLSHKSS